MPNVGIVLSGGFAKGAYQIGVLKAVEEYFGKGDNNSIKYVSASSVGVLNAYAFMQGRTDVAEKIWLSLKCNGYRSFVNLYKRGLFMDSIVNAVSADTRKPPPFLYAACFNVTKLKLNYINFKTVKPREVRDYLHASVRLPVFSKAVEIGGNKYFDGALVDNIPVRPIMKHPLDYAIVIHFDNANYIFENDYFDSRLIKINFLGDSMVKNSLDFDRNSIAYMIKSGYEESKTLFDIIFSNGIDDLEYIYRKIEFLNGIRGRGGIKPQSRLTGDVVVNNINKVLKKVIISKI
ncbi:MAG: patatin-like phospholipase family protein [Oscillospiraceae bacterium]|nr:patatin-like phospholipase family protein [Oscillospiraceae bacterium]